MSNKIKQKIISFFKKKPEKPLATHFVSIGLIFASLCGALSMGFVSSNIKEETLANDISLVVKNNTKNSKYLGVIVEKAISNYVFDSKSNDSEFRGTYAVFRQNRATFAAGFNFNKTHSITVNEFESDVNQSVLYVGQSDSIKYENGYKDVPYPIIFKYPLVRNPADFIPDFDPNTKVPDFCVSISETRAIELISKALPDKDPKDFTDADYFKYVICQPINIVVDGYLQTLSIQNVYYKQDYYYDCLEETVGEFIIFSDYHYPQVEKEKNMSQQRMYYFNEYPYQDKYFFSHINLTYPSSDCVFFVNTNNLIHKDIDLKHILEFRNLRDQQSSASETLLLIFSIAFAFLSMVLGVFYEIYLNKTSLAICFTTLFVPYLIFKIIFAITGNITVFSNIGTKTSGIIIIVYAFVLIFVVAFKNSLSKKRTKNEVPQISI